MYQFRHPTFSVSCKTFGETTARGEALQSLAATDSLRNRFFAWRGASGRRYVCSVFQSGEDSFIADVTNGVVIGVAREGATSRPVCVFLAQERAVNSPNADKLIDSQSSERAPCDRRALRKAAQELGVAEWHVHFCADATTLRDLSASLLN